MTKYEYRADQFTADDHDHRYPHEVAGFILAHSIRHALDRLDETFVVTNLRVTSIRESA